MTSFDEVSYLVVDYAVICHNALPSTARGLDTSPYMGTHGDKFDGGVLRPFGCRACARLRGPEEGTPVDPRGEWGIFIGLNFADGAGNYKFMTSGVRSPRSPPTSRSSPPNSLA